MASPNKHQAMGEKFLISTQVLFSTQLKPQKKDFCDKFERNFGRIFFIFVKNAIALHKKCKFLVCFFLITNQVPLSTQSEQAPTLKLLLWNKCPVHLIGHWWYFARKYFWEKYNFWGISFLFCNEFLNFEIYGIFMSIIIQGSPNSVKGWWEIPPIGENGKFS